MNIEKTIAFILDSQAKAEERFAKADEQHARAMARMDRADQRMDRADRRMDRLEHLVKQLVRSGLSLRSDTRELQRFRLRTEENLAEITAKLDALIDIVDKSIRRNGGKR